MKVFILSDTHHPFSSKRAMKETLKLIKKEKPDCVVQIGDLLDLYTFSKYSRNFDEITPEEEVRKGLKAASEMWCQVQKIVPRAKCYQLLGNHCMRMSKRIQEKLPELAGIVDPIKLFQFRGVKTLKSDRGYIDIDGVRYLHGYLSKSLDHAIKQGRPVVHGHRHRPCIETAGRLWSMDVGFLGDETLLPFQYTQSKTTNWRLACGIVENGVPRLILL